jgi:hypothetical protein
MEIVKFMRRYYINNDLLFAIDSREHPRRACKKSLYFLNKSQQTKGLAINISRGGIFVESGSKMALGECINLLITESHGHKGVNVRGWVVRLGSGGVGISFNRRSGRERRYNLDRRTGLDRRTISKPLNR